MVVDSPVTMLQLRVDPGYPPAPGVPSPLRNGPAVVDEHDETIGLDSADPHSSRNVRALSCCRLCGLHAWDSHGLIA
jgi:hypothetical protein